MKALFVKEIEHLELKDIPYPTLPQEGAMLKVKAAAICGTDLKIFRFGHKRVKFPWIIGHEISGVVEEIDDPSGYYKVGDRVVLNPTVYCGKCYYCKRGMYNICLNPDSYGYERPGGFSEYMIINEDTIFYRELYHIPNDLSFELAAIVEPFACVINGHKDVKIDPESTVLIIGGGTIGIMHAIYSKERGAKNVFIYDINRVRTEKALSFPQIDGAFSSLSTLKDTLQEKTGGIGPDVIIVAAPSPDAQNLALEMVRKRGYVVFFAGIPYGEESISVDTNLIHYKELKVFGSSNSTGLEMETSLSFIHKHKELFSSFITFRFPLLGAYDAFSSAFLPTSYKVIINP